MERMIFATLTVSPPDVVEDGVAPLVIERDPEKASHQGREYFRVFPAASQGGGEYLAEVETGTVTWDKDGESYVRYKEVLIFNNEIRKTLSHDPVLSGMGWGGADLDPDELVRIYPVGNAVLSSSREDIPVYLTSNVHYIYDDSDNTIRMANGFYGAQIYENVPICGTVLVEYDVLCSKFYYTYPTPKMYRAKNGLFVPKVPISIRNDERSGMTEVSLLDIPDRLEVYRVTYPYVADKNGKYEYPDEFQGNPPEMRHVFHAHKPYDPTTNPYMDASYYPSGKLIQKSSAAKYLQIVEQGFIDRFGKFTVRQFTWPILPPYEGNTEYAPAYIVTDRTADVSSDLRMMVNQLIPLAEILAEVVAQKEFCLNDAEGLHIWRSLPTPQSFIDAETAKAPAA